MKKQLLTLAFICTAGITTFAQAPAIQWQQSYGGSNSDMANSIQQTADGGYIVVGESYSNDGDVSGNHGGADYWVLTVQNLSFIALAGTICVNKLPECMHNVKLQQGCFQYNSGFW